MVKNLPKRRSLKLEETWNLQICLTEDDFDAALEEIKNES